jgi:ATP-dependent DNA ligase
MSLLLRTRLTGFIEPCLPSPAERPPAGDGWLHEIKHDGFRIMARRDNGGRVRLVTRHGNDFTTRFPPDRHRGRRAAGSPCLIDGEAIVTDDKGLAVFELVRRQRLRTVEAVDRENPLRADRYRPWPATPRRYAPSYWQVPPPQP